MPSRSFNQEFISEISGIASGEFALEQQLQKAAIGRRDWSSYTSCYTIKTRFFGVKAESVISKAFEDIRELLQCFIKGFRYTFSLDSTNCQRKSTVICEQNVKSCFAKIVAVFFWIFDTKSIQPKLQLKELINPWMVAGGGCMG